MELKPGYKQTEVGVIPEDWDVVEIGEISKTSSGTTPARSQEERYFKKGEFHWIKTMDLNNSLIKDSEEKVTVLALKETCLQMYPIGTVLIAMYGGFNQIGRTGLLGINASVNQALVAIQLVREKVEPRFLLDTLNYRVEYWKSVASSSRKDPNITSNDVKHFSFPIPSTRAEQTAIANALSDADALIQSLTSFIAKKRQIKQGAMQTLLNPYENGRLKEGWEEKKLGEIGVFRGGCGFPTRYQGKTDGLYPFYKVSDMNNEGNEKLMINANNWIDEKVKKEIGVTTFPKNTIIFAKIGAAIFLERKKILNQESCIDNNLMGYVFDTNLYSVEYLHYLFQTIPLGKLVSTTALPSLNGKEISAQKYYFPNKLDQTRIATILSGMDAEIAALEAKLEKYRQIKQGMMQNLLTGRIRLI